MKTVLMISCEHATHHIPAEFQDLFRGHKKTLVSHRGWDRGAPELYQLLKKADIAVHHQAAKTSRLLIDLNRSLHHAGVFSEISRKLTKESRILMVQNYYAPYRSKMIERIRSFTAERIRVIHLSLHSFATMLNGEIRNNDIGLLYDPKRSSEVAFCNGFRKLMSGINPEIKLRMNYPYRGISDGFTSFLRQEFSNRYYAGIEIEMNQKHFNAAGQCRTSLINNIKDVVFQLINGYNY